MQFGRSALTLAAEKGKLEIVELLLSRNADVNAQDEVRRSRGEARGIFDD